MSGPRSSTGTTGAGSCSSVGLAFVRHSAPACTSIGGTAISARCSEPQASRWGQSGSPVVLSGPSLAIAWAAEAAVLAWLAQRIVEPRYQLAALAYLAAATVDAFAWRRRRRISTRRSATRPTAPSPRSRSRSPQPSSPSTHAGGQSSGPSGFFAYLEPVLAPFREFAAALRAEAAPGWRESRPSTRPRSASSELAQAIGRLIGRACLRAGPRLRDRPLGPGRRSAWCSPRLASNRRTCAPGLLLAGRRPSSRRRRSARVSSPAIASAPCSSSPQRACSPSRSPRPSQRRASDPARGPLGPSRSAAWASPSSGARPSSSPTDATRASRGSAWPPVFDGCSQPWFSGRPRLQRRVLWGLAAIVAAIGFATVLSGNVARARLVCDRGGGGSCSARSSTRSASRTARPGTSRSRWSTRSATSPRRGFLQREHGAGDGRAQRRLGGRIGARDVALRKAALPRRGCARAAAASSPSWRSTASTLTILGPGPSSGSGSASFETDFQRGHSAVSAFWGVIALITLYAGLTRDLRVLRLAGFALFGLALAKLFLYDLANLSSITRALSFLAVGGVPWDLYQRWPLLAGFFYQRLDWHGAIAPATRPRRPRPSLRPCAPRGRAGPRAGGRP